MPRLASSGLSMRKADEEVEGVAGGWDEKKRPSLVQMASSITREFIKTSKAPAPIGPYNQAVRVGNTLYLSGSVGFVPETGELPSDFKEQTHNSLKNIGAVLSEAGLNYGNVVKTTVLLSNMADFPTMNEIYKEYFTSNFPARTAYQAAALPKGALVEIECIAVAGEIKDA